MIRDAGTPGTMVSSVLGHCCILLLLRRLLCDIRLAPPHHPSLAIVET